MKKILITGGAGFIGSHVANHFHQLYPNQVLVLDSLTYASNRSYLKPEIEFRYGDITNAHFVNLLFLEQKFTDVIHLAAESHVDNSIANPNIFATTNVMGTLNLLNAAQKLWGDSQEHRFYHISTDEVYGSLELDSDEFTETTPYSPRSPYSASKAASDHFVRSYFHTYNLPILISNCSNNYGPNQHREKLIPKVITNIINRAPIPVYGLGNNIRDWLWVGDHVSAIDIIFHKGILGETYNIGGNTELTNIQLVKLICSLMDKKMGIPLLTNEKLITYVTDRKGHDLRYAINSSKLRNQLGWEPKKDLIEGLKETIDFYSNTI